MAPADGDGEGDGDWPVAGAEASVMLEGREKAEAVDGPSTESSNINIPQGPMVAFACKWIVLLVFHLLWDLTIMEEYRCLRCTCFWSSGCVHRIFRPMRFRVCET